MNRRELLKRVGVVAGAKVAQAAEQNPSSATRLSSKCKIVVTGGHPGDPEYGCGGSVARLTALGHEVVLLYLNDGAWAQTSSATRLAENHSDHRAIANLTYESWKQLKRRFALYYYEVSDGEDTTQFPAPTQYVDITAVADTKKAACYAHASQTPDFYYPLQDTVATFRGLQAGAKKAEAYVLQLGSP